MTDTTPSIFGPDALQKAIDAELGTIPAGHRWALVGYWTTDHVWQMTIARKIGDHWQFGATAGKDQPDADIQGGFHVRATW